MENTENSAPVMAFTETMKSDLLQTAHWAKFLAIVGFVGLGLMAVFAILMMSGASYLNSLINGDFVTSTLIKGESVISAYTGILYLLIGLLYFFPLLYLLRFSTNTKRAVLANEEAAMEEALINQRKMFKFMGILMIVILSIYALLALIWLPIAILAL
jgi:hypothetical protein